MFFKKRTLTDEQVKTHLNVMFDKWSKGLEIRLCASIDDYNKTRCEKDDEWKKFQNTRSLDLATHHAAHAKEIETFLRKFCEINIAILEVLKSRET